jgi:hypothetical protein
MSTAVSMLHGGFTQGIRTPAFGEISSGAVTLFCATSSHLCGPVNSMMTEVWNAWSSDPWRCFLSDCNQLLNHILCDLDGQIVSRKKHFQRQLRERHIIGRAEDRQGIEK